MNVDEVIAQVTRLAARQHGLVRTDQVDPDDLGRLRHLAKRGILERVGVGVYRIAGAPVTWRQQLQAGSWALGTSAVVSHRAAAQLHGFDGFERDVVEFTIDRDRRGRRPAAVPCSVHTTTKWFAGDRATVDGLPVTSPVRTIIDLARDRAAIHDLEAAVDSAIRLRLTTLDRLIERMGRQRGRAAWGLGLLYALVMTSGGHTALERRFLEVMRDAGLPTPTPQVVHRVDGRHIARVDFHFAGTDVVVEVSGGRGHSSAAERAKDARRRNALQQLGRIVLEFTYEQVMNEPGMVVATVLAALSQPNDRTA